MARSKSGGTRSYIRGRIGADVYAIGKDGKGTKQQVARSLAEEVANPRTLAQQRSRMIMNGVAQLVRALKPIISHSFDGIPAGQPSVSHFRKLAFEAYNADVLQANPLFGYLAKDSKLIPNGDFLISSGKAVAPITWRDGVNNQMYEGYGTGGFSCWIPWHKEEGHEWGAKISGAEALDLVFKGDTRNSYTYVALVAITDENTGELKRVVPVYARVSYKPSEAEKEELYDEWDCTPRYGGVVEGNINLQMYINFGQYSDGDWAFGNFTPRFNSLITSGENAKAIAQCVIWSECVAGKGIIHSTAGFVRNALYQEDGAGVLKTYIYPVFPMLYTNAIQSYPIGADGFLNGGSLNGGSEQRSDSLPATVPSVTSLKLGTNEVLGEGEISLANTSYNASGLMTFLEFGCDASVWKCDPGSSDGEKQSTIKSAEFTTGYTNWQNKQIVIKYNGQVIARSKTIRKS